MASAVAGIATGLVDTVLSLAGVPDSANATHRLGIIVGLVPFAVLWAVPVGVVAARLAPGRRGPLAAAAAVLALWGLGVVTDAAARGVSTGVVVTVLALAVGGVAVARLAVDAGDRGRRGSTPAPAGGWLVLGGVALFALLAASMPGVVSPHLGGGGPCPDARTPVPRGPNVVLVTVDALRADAAREMASYRRLAARGREYHPARHRLALDAAVDGVPPDGRVARGARRRAEPRHAVARGALGRRGARAHARGGAGRRRVSHPCRRHEPVPHRASTASTAASARSTTSRWRGEYVRDDRPDDARSAWRASSCPASSRRIARIGCGRGRKRWLARRDERPFFLWIHFLDPHAPYGDREGASTSLVLDLMALQRRTALEETPFHEIALLRAGEYRPSTAERTRIAELYRQDVAYADAEIDRLLDTLDARGLAGRTAIVFTADHGEEFWEHGGVEHGRTLYEEVLRVPMIVVPPGGVAPLRSNELTTVLDVAPTIATLAGVALPGAGTDLLSAAPRATTRVGLGTMLFGEGVVGVRTAPWKYARSEGERSDCTTWRATPASCGTSRRRMAAVTAGERFLLPHERRRAYGSGRVPSIETAATRAGKMEG